MGKIKEQITNIVSLQRHNFIIEPFNVNVDLWYGDFHKYHKQVEEHYNIADITPAIEGKANTTITIRDHEGVSYFILLFSNKNGIVHESIHLSWKICEATDIQLTPGNHEMQTYLVDHIIREISKKI